MIGPIHQDDRGNRVRLSPCGNRAPQAGGWTFLVKDVSRRAWKSKGAVGVVAALALVGLPVGAWLNARDVIPLFFFSPIGSTLVALLAVTFLSIAQAWHAWPVWVRETHLRQQTCPVCLYGLNGQPVQADGCVVCPECASAWNVADELAMAMPRHVVIVKDEYANSQDADKSTPPTMTRDTSCDPNS